MESWFSPVAEFLFKYPARLFGQGLLVWQNRALLPVIGCCWLALVGPDRSDRDLISNLSISRTITLQSAAPAGAGQIVGVEVKASATVTAADFRGLRKLKEAAGRRFGAGLVLYDGETSASFVEGLHAVPLGTLWGTTELDFASQVRDLVGLVRGLDRVMR